MAKRIGLIIGHSLKSPGAVNLKCGVSEYAFNTALAFAVKDCLDVAGLAPVIITRDGRPYSQMPAFALAHSLDLAVEFHANSVPEGVPFNFVAGHEVWYFRDSIAGRFLAQRLNAGIHEALRNKDRGIKAGTADDRAGIMLRYVGGEIPYALLEPFFICSDQELANATIKRQELAGEIAKAIIEFLGAL